jgi:hypothetical protein
MSAIHNVRKFFPQVETVKDASKRLTLEVTKHDAANSHRKKHSECAMAVACKRAMKLDGVIVSATTAYLIKDTVATRYELPMAAQKEVVAFDRGGGFSPGEYQLLKPSHNLGRQEGGKDKRARGTEPKRRHHYTEGIRAILGSREIR